MTGGQCLVLRLTAPLQSWGSSSQFNRRETDSEPTKSGLIGLLAAADGRRREDPIEDLLGLRFGVRVDQAGTLLRDYHTVSDFRGGDLRSSEVTSKGEQKRNRGKATAVTERFYLQDAVFIAAISGPAQLMNGLGEAVSSPGFPLSLGRRSCPPTLPLVLGGESGVLWAGDIAEVLRVVPWQANEMTRRRHQRTVIDPTVVTVSCTVDDEAGPDRRVDVPVSFEPRERGFVGRTVSRRWIQIPTGIPPVAEGTDVQRRVAHDPFALLGW